MSLTMTAAPAVEPVTLAEAKAHARIDGTAEDAYLTSLIVTSRLQIEAALGLALITQRWRWTLDRWPDDGVLAVPLRPVQSVEAIEIAAPGGGTATLPATAYHLDGRSSPARIVLDAYAPPAPDAVAEGIAARFTAGFGAAASDVPAPIRHALLLLVTHWYEHRDPACGDDRSRASPIPAAVSALLAPYRTVRL